MFQAFPKAIITGVHLLSELMGADRYAYLDIGSKTNMVVRVNPRNMFDEDTKIEVAIDMNKALYFDTDTGARLID
jgi:multiple sugar transport system ATP-binding protein